MAYIPSRTPLTCIRYFGPRVLEKEHTTNKLRPLWISTKTLAFTLKHTTIRVVSDGEDMRRHLMSFAALVELDDLFRIDGQPFVRVDDDAKQARVGLEKSKLPLLCIHTYCILKRNSPFQEQTN